MISSAGDGCFAPRELEVGFNVTASVGEVVFIPVGEIGNTISLVGANTFPDYTIINFPNNDVFAVGHSLWNSGNGITEYRIYGEVDILMETYTLTSAVSQEFFFGFIADEVITKVEIQAANDQGELFGEFLFGICNEPPPPPANDDCENAVSVTVDAEGTGCYSPTVATNLDATGSSEPDPACGSYSGGDVWYSFTAPATRAVKIIIPIVGEWSSFSGALYDGCAGTEIDCKVIDGIDISANVPAEDFYNNLTPGNTYYLRAWDNDNDDIGEVSFCIEEYTYVDIENIDNKGFTYFPNPVNSTLTLSSQDNIQNISIYNITGQLIINIIPNSNQTQIDLKRLVNGVYFVKATINNELAVFKIIKE